MRDYSFSLTVIQVWFCTPKVFVKKCLHPREVQKAVKSCADDANMATPSQKRAR